MTEAGASLAYRRAEDRDRPLIFDSWLSSFADAHAAGLIPMHMYRRVYHEAIAWIMARPGAETWVAYHPGEHDTTADLYGWICIERGHAAPVIHYAFVKQAFRRMGIARGLLAATDIDPTAPLLFTFKTGIVTDSREGPALLAKLPRAKWAPMVARFPRP